jgi:Xaa-Pro aminopeptidase
MPATHAARRERLRQVLRQREVDAAVVSNLVNVRYLTGFTGSNAALLVRAGGPGGDPALFCTDGRYDTQAGEEVPDLERVIARSCDVALVERAAADRLLVLGYESHHVTVDRHATLARTGGPVRLVSLRRAVEDMRLVKDEDEIELLRRACTIADQALAELLAAGGIRPGRTESEVGRDLDSRMLDLGARAISFETIVATGPNSAIPHHRPTGRVLAAGDFVKLDFGAEYGGYHSDMTRTMVLGRPAGWQREIYDLVAAAQAAGRQALAVGADVVAVDRAARQVIEDAGYGRQFGHGLGHGVGLEIHELPTVSPLGAGTLAGLSPVTVEPGVYLAGRGGVRIEDTLVVRAAGPELLTLTGKELVAL